jgi:uncharacterized protein YdiU (UPF0061 family)
VTNVETGSSVTGTYELFLFHVRESLSKNQYNVYFLRNMQAITLFEVAHVMPTKAYRFDQEPSIALTSLHESFQAITSLLAKHDLPNETLEELRNMVQGQHYVTALKRMQVYTQHLKSERLEVIELLVKAWQQLSLHAEMQYRMACKGLQRVRHLRVDSDEMKQEAALHVELGEQCAESQKGLYIIQAWRRRLTAAHSVQRPRRAASA